MSERALILNVATQDFALLADEHRALIRQLGRVQARCSALLDAQSAEIARLQAQVMQLRAMVILRETALAWMREDSDTLLASIPGLPRRITLARRIEVLMSRVRELMQEGQQNHRDGPWHGDVAHQRAVSHHKPEHTAGASSAVASAVFSAHEPDFEASLDSCLDAADLVICQTGCLSHGDYWRVQDQCKRSGKACVLVDQPDAVRIVRIRQRATADQGLSVDAEEI